jgi:hypothetical protein
MEEKCGYGAGWTRAECMLSQQEVGWRGVSWTSKSTKKQNGTIENYVCDWGELENSQEKGWLWHGLPVRESEWRNTITILGNKYMCVCVCV